MAQDGSIEVAWKGNAFPYLMHHPNSYLKSENYGSAKTAAPHAHGHGSAAPHHGNGESNFQAGTGTWDGPAPRGAGMKANIVKPNTGPINEPQQVRLSTGAAMPILGLGTFGIQSPDAIKLALSIGYRHFDCAELYGNEEVVGEGLKDFVASGKREELFLVSKVWNSHHRPDDVRAACERSLKKLGVQYLDQYLVHWPETWVPSTEGIPPVPEVDTEVTMEQTWAAMEALVDAGLVRTIGVSNFSLTQVEALLATCRIKPVVNQVELQPMLAQRKLIGVLFRKGVHCVAYSPIGSQGQCPSEATTDLKAHDAVVRVAKEAGKTPVQVLLKWNTQRGITVIPKTSSEAHLRENFEGFFDWKLSNEQKALLDGMDCGKRFVSFPWKEWGNAEEGGVTKPSTVVL